MNKKRVAATFVLIFLCLPILVVQGAGESWLTGWTYRKSHVLQAAAGSGANYTVYVVVNYTSGSDSDNVVYVDGACQADFDDIRFTDSGGGTKYGYFVEEKTDSDYALFGVTITDDLSADDVTIYVYYGNALASSESDFASAGIYGDGFDDDDISDWTLSGSTGAISVTDGIITVDDPASSTYLTSPSFSSVTAFRLKFRLQISDVEGYSFLGAADGVGSTAANRLQQLGYQTVTADTQRISYYSGSAWSNIDTNNGKENFHVVESLVADTTVDDDDLRVNDGDLKDKDLRATKSSIDRVYWGISYVDDPVTDLDWIYVAKYVSSEPTHGAWGTEEEESTYQNTVDCISPVGTETSLSVTFVFNITFYQEIQNASVYTNASGSWVLTQTNTSELTANATNYITYEFSYAQEGVILWNVGVFNSTHEIFDSSNVTFSLVLAPAWQNLFPDNETLVAYGDGLSIGVQGYDNSGLDLGWLSTNESASWQNYTTLINSFGEGTAEWYLKPAECYNDVVYFVYLTDAQEIKIVSYNHTSENLSSAVTIEESWGAGDDHDSPSVHVIKNGANAGKILVGAAVHNDKLCVWLSENAEDITGSWTETQIEADHATYANFVETSDGDIFLFYRDIDTITFVFRKSTNGGESWSSRTTLINPSGSDIPYAMVYGIGNEIHVAWNRYDTSDGWVNIYHFFSDDSGDNWKLLDETALSLPVTEATADVVYSTKSGKNTRIWDVKLTSASDPYIISVDNSSNAGGIVLGGQIQRHNYDEGWQTEYIGFDTDNTANHYYHGGAVLDCRDMNTIYACVNVSETNEVMKIEKVDSVWTSTENITTGSDFDNFRPFSVINYSQSYDEFQMIWVQNNEVYGSWMSWNTEIRLYPAYQEFVDFEGAAQAWTWGNFTWRNSELESGTVVMFKIYINDTDGNIAVTSTGFFYYGHLLNISVIFYFNSDTMGTFYVDGTEISVNGTVRFFDYNESMVLLGAPASPSYAFESFANSTATIAETNPYTHYALVNASIVKLNLKLGGDGGYMHGWYFAGMFIVALVVGAIILIWKGRK